MADGVWRSFKFFETHRSPAGSPLASLKYVCSTISPVHFFVGECEGQVVMMDRQAATVVCRYQAYAGPVTHMKYVASRHSLVTLGDDDAVNRAILRVWDLDQCMRLYQSLTAEETSNGSPDPAAPPASLLWRPPCREHRLLSSKTSAASDGAAPMLPILLDEHTQRLLHFAAPPKTDAAVQDGISCDAILSPVVALDVAADMSCAAVGLSNRDCIVLHGDLANERAIKSRVLRSGVAKEALTFVALPAVHQAALLDRGSGSPKPSPATNRKSTTDDEAAAASPSPSLRPFAFLSSFSGGSTRELAQLLYAVHEDVVTCWAIGASGAWTEYICAAKGGAPYSSACLNANGELLLYQKTSAGGTITRLGPASPATNTTTATASGEKSAIGVSSVGTAPPLPYDPTSSSSVQITDIGHHLPGRCRLFSYRHYAVLLIQQEGRPDHYHLQCYDLTYHLRSLSRPQETYQHCAAILCDEAAIVVLTQDPAALRQHRLSLQATRLVEVDTQTKLELLFSKECYGIAQQIAQEVGGADPTLTMNIRRRYGDYLYQKGRFEEAMTQYMDTIGFLEPSFVIRRYMEAPQIHLLIQYLEELHHQRHGQLANLAHTTLLLKCYIKQNDETRLMQFVHRNDVRFEVRNAIEVCREGGYATAALYIADRYAQVMEYARIRLRDLKEPIDTLAFLRSLGVDDVEQIGMALGRELLQAAPRRTTELFIELCIHWKGPARRLMASHEVAEALLFDTAAAAPPPRERHPHRSDPQSLLHVFVSAPLCLMNFLRAVVESGVLDGDGLPATANTSTAVVEASPYTAVYNTLLELYMTKELNNTLQLNDTGRSTTPVKAKDESGNDDEGFPMEPYEQRLMQARAFLELYRGRYDDYLALSLAHQHCFTDGILYLLHQLHLSEELLSYYATRLSAVDATATERQAAADQLFEACKSGVATASGTKAMWISLLTQLLRCATTEWQEIARVLDYIEEHDILSPVVVLEVLSSIPTSASSSSAPAAVPPTLRLVREYCQRCLMKQTRRVQDVTATTAGHLQKIEELKQGITALQTTAVVFQDTSCSHCHQPLDAPSLYFMCRHVFHHRCLHAPMECNICGPTHRQQLEAIHDDQLNGGAPPLERQAFTMQFLADLKRGRTGQPLPSAEETAGPATTTSDGLVVMAEYVGRGLLGVPPLSRDAFLFSSHPPHPLRGGADGGRQATSYLAPEDMEIW